MFKTALWSGLAALAVLVGSVAVCAAAQEPETLKTAWLAEHEAFAAWYGKERGWDREAGFVLEMERYPSGRELIAGIGESKWSIGACGALPALAAVLESRLEIVGVGNDESYSTGIYARPDSPILGTVGHNPAFPGMAGSPATVKGKVILCPVGSSAFYTVAQWLRGLGLSVGDVVIRDVNPKTGLEAFARGEGEAIAFWAPFTHEAERLGLKPVVMSSQCGASQPILLVANQAFASRRPERVAAFLKMYFRGIDALRTAPRETLIKDYQRFYREWTGRDLSPEAAAWELERHPVYTLEEQIAMFGPEGHLMEWLRNLAHFHGGDNRLKFVTDAYLKMAAQ